MEKKVNVTVGPGVGGLLGVLFVALKLTGQIDWSWFWVLSPFWIPFAIILGFIGFMFLVALIAAILK